MPRLSFRKFVPCCRFCLFDPLAGLAWLSHPAVHPFAPRGFPASVWPVTRRFVQARRGYDLAWRKPGWPRRPFVLRVKKVVEGWGEARTPTSSPGCWGLQAHLNLLPGFGRAVPLANPGLWSFRRVKSIRLRHAVFRLRLGLWSGGLLNPAVASTGRGASRVSTRRPVRLLQGSQARSLSSKMSHF